MGVSSSESHDLTAFYEMLSASFGVLSQNTGFYPSLDRIIETTLRPLNLGPGGGSYNEPISCLHHNPVNHAATKHVNVRYHFIRECITDGTIDLKLIGMNDMAADILTKALAVPKHEPFFQILRMLMMP